MSDIFGAFIGAGVGVGGTTVGVEGCCITGVREEECATETGVEYSFEAGEGVESTPKELKSGPSVKTTVPPPNKACSKSRSVRETRLAAEEPVVPPESRPLISFEATGRKVER